MADKRYELIIETVLKNGEKIDALIDRMDKERAAERQATQEKRVQLDLEKQRERYRQLEQGHAEQVADIERRKLPQLQQEKRLELEILNLRKQQAQAGLADEHRFEMRRRELALERERVQLQRGGGIFGPGSFARTAAVGAGIGLGYGAVRGATGFARTGIEFNAQMETARLGIAGVLAQFDDMGEFENFDAAIERSVEAIDLLKQKASESPASLRELIAAFQGTAGAAAASSLSVQEHVNLITTMSQTLSALGIRPEQILQESRALMTGNITEDAMAAKILGITKAQIDAAKEQGQLYEFLSGKMAGFAEAAARAEQNFEVLTSNLGDEVDQLAGLLTEDLFGRLKGVIGETKDFVRDLREALQGIDALSTQREARQLSEEELTRRVRNMTTGDAKGVLAITQSRQDVARRELANLFREDAADANRFRELDGMNWLTRRRTDSDRIDGSLAKEYRQLQERIDARRNDIADAEATLRRMDSLLNAATARATDLGVLRANEAAQAAAAEEQRLKARKAAAEQIAGIEGEHAEKMRELDFQRMSVTEQMVELELRRFQVQMQQLGVDDPKELVELKKEELELDLQIAVAQQKQAEEKERAAEAAAQEVLAAAKLAGYAVAEDGNGFVRANLTRYDAARASVYGQSIFSSPDGQTFSNTGRTQGGLGDPDQHFQDIGQGAEAAVLQYAASVGTVADQISTQLQGIFSQLESGATNALTGLILGTQTWEQALAAVGETVLTAVVGAIVQMGVQWVLTQLLMATVGKGIMSGVVASSMGEAALLGAAWSPAAIAASIATSGGASAAGLAAYQGAQLAGAASSFLGAFEGGGLLPGGPGFFLANEKEPEFVVNGPATRRWLPVLEDINAGREPRMGGRSGNVKISGAFVNSKAAMRGFMATEGRKFVADMATGKITDLID